MDLTTESILWAPLINSAIGELEGRTFQTEHICWNRGYFIETCRIQTKINPFLLGGASLPLVLQAGKLHEDKLFLSQPPVVSPASFALRLSATERLIDAGLDKILRFPSQEQPTPSDFSHVHQSLEVFLSCILRIELGQHNLTCSH